MSWVDFFSMFSYAKSSVVSWVLVRYTTYIADDCGYENMDLWHLVLHLEYASKKNLQNSFLINVQSTSTSKFFHLK